jgi:predicted RNase H-like nuclease
MNSVLAIDAAWTASEPSGVALIVERKPREWECVAVAPSYAAFIDQARGTEVTWNAPKFRGSTPNPKELIEAATRLVGDGQGPTVATVDMPMATVPITVRRASDDEISRLFGGRGCSAHSPNSLRPGALGAGLTQGFVREGYALATTRTIAGTAGQLIEVYPHPTLLSILDVDYRVEYKVARSKKYWPDLNVQERIERLVRKFNQILQALNQDIDGIRLPIPSVDDVRSLAYLKRFEDALDALICGWMGIQYFQGGARSVGDATAAIWIPQE